MFDSNGDGRFDPGDAAWDSAMGHSSEGGSGGHNSSGNQPGCGTELLGAVIVMIIAGIIMSSC